MLKAISGRKLRLQHLPTAPLTYSAISPLCICHWPSRNEPLLQKGVWLHPYLHGCKGGIQRTAITMSALLRLQLRRVAQTRQGLPPALPQMGSHWQLRLVCEEGMLSIIATHKQIKGREEWMLISGCQSIPLQIPACIPAAN